MVEWYTHRSKKPAPQGLRVQVPPLRPKVMLEDICTFCHHYKDEHTIESYYNSEGAHLIGRCSGYVSDGQGECGCYCTKYIEGSELHK